MVQHTDDGRWIVVDGRRWRATDPTLPPERRQELVDELMAARRAVAAARRAADQDAERAARARVHAAKVGLGERGPAWWERIEQAIVEAVAERGEGKTICPSEVARRLVGDGDLTPVMPHVREAAAVLAERGAIVVTQRRRPVDARSVKGPIRLGRPPASGARGDGA